MNDSIDQIVTSELKRFPDFVICEFWGPACPYEDRHDKVKMVVEVGSTYSKTVSENRWREVILQTIGYCILVGSERWKKGGVGVAIIGYEVAVCRLVDGVWAAYGTRFSIFSESWNNLMNEIELL